MFVGEILYSSGQLAPLGNRDAQFGIIDSVFGDIVGGSISGFFLGDKPVPVTEFE